MIELLSKPWHWSISGVAIVFVMFILLWFGGRFGASSNLRTLCAIGGAGKRHQFFDFDWNSQIWNLVFIGSAIIGGFIAVQYLPNAEPMQISESTIVHFKSLGISAPVAGQKGMSYVPAEIFSSASFFNPKNLFMLIVGGFLVGFGARYAGGCTSGHAISGLSNLQLPSLIAVVGFFIGGLIMTWLFLPFILTF